MKLIHILLCLLFVSAATLFVGWVFLFTLWQMCNLGG